MPEFTELARGFYLEGLLVDGEDIWFTDVTRGGVHNLATGQTVLPERTMIGGLARNADGRLLVSGADGIAWVDPATGASGLLIEGLGGINEMRGDPAGGLWFGTIDLAAIIAGKAPAASSLCHLAADRTLRELRGDLTFANGLAPSPDGKRLYFNESFSGTCAFPIDADGAIGAPLWRLANRDCDGMALDCEGHAWVTGFGSAAIVRLSPDGSATGRIAVPGPACTNIRFGGDDMRDIYVTVVDTAAARLLAEGKPLTERSSALYRGRSPIAGAPLARTGFVL
ncbi:MAG: SMP-30/gluconolactonase/LRE family protein [Novosphingobium sp.]